MTNGVKAVAREFAGVRIGINWVLVGSILAVFFFGFIRFSLIADGKKGWGWVFVGLAFILLLFVTWMIMSALRSRGRSRSWRSGGLGGFGGGSSGGGGATGSW